MMRTRVRRLLSSNFSYIRYHCPKGPILESAALFHPASTKYMSVAHLSTIPSRPLRGDRRREDPSEDLFLRNLDFGDEAEGGKDEKPHRNPPSRLPDRPLRGDRRAGPLRGEKRSDEGFQDLFPELNDEPQQSDSARRGPRGQIPSRPLRGDRKGKDGLFDEKFKVGNEGLGKSFDLLREKEGFGKRPGREASLNGSLNIDDRSEEASRNEKGSGPSRESLFEKLKLGEVGRGEKVEEAHQKPLTQTSGTDTIVSESSPEDAEQIFKKMKETGLIPNAVAMLDGLCKDGLVQEAMKLFGLMREKGTIPEVVIYTAVVEGFCKAAKYEDAKRIFKKMQKNGIVPNAFSYTVLIQGFCKGKQLEDSVEFCMEMLDAGHSPNAATFTALVDGFCKEKGVEEAEAVVKRLRERGFALDDKTIRDYMDKKGPFTPLVWEAIFGKKVSRKPF